MNIFFPFSRKIFPNVLLVVTSFGAFLLTISKAVNFSKFLFFPLLALFIFVGGT